MTIATLKFTIVGRYEASSKDYDTSDPAAMAELDQDSYDSGEVTLHDLIEWASDRDMSVKIEAEA